MKITIITAAYNSASNLQRCIDSVYSQTHLDKEHIIIDGNSTDNTLEIIRSNEDKISRLISEKDTGIYDAINKGIKLATGDVIGLLHSDDFFSDEFVLEKYAGAFQDKRIKEKEKSIPSSREEPGDIKDPDRFLTPLGIRNDKKYDKSSRADARDLKDFSVTSLLRNDNLLSTDNSQPPTNDNPQPIIDAVYSDLVYVREKSNVKSQKSKSVHIDNSELKIGHSVIRYWKAHPSHFDFAQYDALSMTKWLKNGWMPPHPTLFVRKEIFEKYGLYRTDMKIAADYEMILRLFYKHKITTHYLPLTTYCMTIGGASNKSLKNIFIKSSEDYRAMKMHSLPFPLYSLLCKNLSKLPQFLTRQ